MKRILGILILFGVFSTTAVAQQQKPRIAYNRAGNADGEFTRRETATVRRVEKNAIRAERRAEKRRIAENNRRKIDARRTERSLARQKS